MAYPHGRFRYKVEIDGLEAGGFSEVTGFNASVDVMGYRAGDMVQTPVKIPGLKTITITLLDEEETPAASWQVINAWPTKYTAPDFNATSSEVAIETLEIAHEGMTRVL